MYDTVPFTKKFDFKIRRDNRNKFMSAAAMNRYGQYIGAISILGDPLKIDEKNNSIIITKCWLVIKELILQFYFEHRTK